MTFKQPFLDNVREARASTTQPNRRDEMRSEQGHLIHFVSIGMRGRKIMPFSEVCMHMRVADKYMDFEVINGGGDRRNPFVQLYVTDENTPRFSQPFSGPITQGEAGLFDAKGVFDTDHDCFYYPHEYQDQKRKDTGNLDEAAEAEPECATSAGQFEYEDAIEEGV